MIEMSMISEQVRKIRIYEKEYRRGNTLGWMIQGTEDILKNAADTIEELSAKLASANMEKSERHYNRSDDCIGKTKEPDEEEIDEVYMKLKEYEDLEEQGMLVRLPCKVGDTVYRINPYAKEPIISMKVLQIRFGELYVGNSFLRIDAINDEDMGEFCYFKNDVGKTVFLTKSEAEAALEEMEGK